MGDWNSGSPKGVSLDDHNSDANRRYPWKLHRC